MASLEVKKIRIKSILAANNEAVERALIHLLDRQTADERATQNTVHLNGRGFNYQDAGFLTSLAQKVKASTYAPGDRLTRRQFLFARRLVPKYWRQLVEIADARNPHWAD